MTTIVINYVVMSLSRFPTYGWFLHNVTLYTAFMSLGMGAPTGSSRRYVSKIKMAVRDRSKVSNLTLRSPKFELVMIFQEHG